MSFDLFVWYGGGVDFGIYYDYETGEFGVFGDGHVGFGYDQGGGITIQITDDPENLAGDFGEGEVSPSGLLEVNQTSSGVTSVNLNLGNPGPSGHTSAGTGGIFCIAVCDRFRGDLR